MSAEQDIPRPPETVPSSGQGPQDDSNLIVLAQPMGDLPIVKTVSGLAATHSRAMGGEIGAALIAAATAQLGQDLRSARTELVSLRRHKEELQSELSDARRENAVLTERIENDRSTKHIRHFSIFVGTTLMGFAIKLGDLNLTVYAVAAAALGIVLLITGWRIQPRRTQK